MKITNDNVSFKGYDYVYPAKIKDSVNALTLCLDNDNHPDFDNFKSFFDGSEVNDITIHSVNAANEPESRFLKFCVSINNKPVFYETDKFYLMPNEKQALKVLSDLSDLLKRIIANPPDLLQYTDRNKLYKNFDKTVNRVVSDTNLRETFARVLLVDLLKYDYNTNNTTLYAAKSILEMITTNMTKYFK